MPQQHAPVGEIRHYSEGEVESPLPGNLWVVASNGSWWVHPDAGITTPKYSSSSHFCTTLQTSEGYVPITVYPSINGSGRLIGVDDGWVTHCIVQTHPRTPGGMQESYLEYLRPFSYNWQRDFFHPVQLM